MIHTIRVQTTTGPDLIGDGLLHDIRTFLGDSTIKEIKTVKVYRLEDVTKEQAILLAEKLFAEKINQKYSLNRSLITDATEILEIGYKPGVMNPEVASIMKAAKDLHIPLLAADTSREYAFYGKIPKEKIITLLENINLYNKLIEHIVEKSPETLII